MEDLFFWLTEWAGVDFASMSRGRFIFALVIQLLFASLFVGGGALMIIRPTEKVGLLTGLALVLVGLGLLVRIAIHLRPVMRKSVGGA